MKLIMRVNTLNVQRYRGTGIAYDSKSIQVL